MQNGITEACWPVFEFITNFERQLKHGRVADPEQVRYEALSALRDATDLARNEPTVERQWDDRVQAIMVYMIDYIMLNADWEGRNYWYENLFETDPQLLNHAQALGGEEFFNGCDELQREFELAERRDRSDRAELAEVLGIYFSCLRLGFKGQFHDRPQELADYTRRLFNRLPAYTSTRSKEMFPEAYKHNQELKADYKLGLRLSYVVIVFAGIFLTWWFTTHWMWAQHVEQLHEAKVRAEQIVSPAPPT